jgi:hypothetical protein
MTKNQKIAAGCGAVGCLGLMVIIVAGCVVYFSYYHNRPSSASYNYNYNSNSNSNSDSNSNRNVNSGSSNSNSSAPPSTSSSSSMSNDDKHKLFQAAGITKDSELIQKVLKKIGLMNASGVPTDEYGPFMKDHISWAVNNVSFINSVNTPESGRAYVDAHLKD